MTVDLAHSLTAIVDHLIVLSSEDAQLRSHLRQLAQDILRSPEMRALETSTAVAEPQPTVAVEINESLTASNEGETTVSESATPERTERSADSPERTDAELKHLAGFMNLTELAVSFTLDLSDDTAVTDAGLKELAGLTNLTALDLGCTAVTDTGLKELVGLTSLTELSLCDTQVTDTEVNELAGLKKLNFLSLRGTAVTDKGVTELRKALPKCKIVK